MGYLYILPKGKSLDHAATRSTIHIAVVADEFPTKGRAGSHEYLWLLLTYFAERQFQVSLIITGQRFLLPIFRLDTLVALPNVVISGLYFKRLSQWAIVTSWRAWRHFIFWTVLAYAPAWARNRLSKIRKFSLGGAEVFMGRFLSKKERISLAKAVSRVDPNVLLVNTIFCSFDDCLAGHKFKTFMLTHDIFWKREQSFADRGVRVLPHITKETEQGILTKYDLVIGISDEDSNQLKEMLGHDRVATITMPMRVDFKKPDEGDADRILFIGSRGQHNIDGMNWFLLEVWPHVRDSRPNARIDIVGSVCEALADIPGANKHYMVENIGDIAKRCRLSINPVRAGSGLKIKMIDYISFGLPCVTSTQGAQGFPRNGKEPFLVRDQPDAFASTVVSLLTSPNETAALSRLCPEYATNFSREKVYDRLDAIFGIVKNCGQSGL